jgi:hypothetical protein
MPRRGDSIMINRNKQPTVRGSLQRNGCRKCGRTRDKAKSHGSHDLVGDCPAKATRAARWTERLDRDALLPARGTFTVPAPAQVWPPEGPKLAEVMIGDG